MEDTKRLDEMEREMKRLCDAKGRLWMLKEGKKMEMRDEAKGEGKGRERKR